MPAHDEPDLVREKPRSTNYQYPFAAAPDIIRSNQKDAYFQGVLLEHLSSIIRKLYGSRFLHTYTTEAHTFSDLLYLGLTTFIGNRTLGEEYCDIVQVEDATFRLPSIQTRAGYILLSILFPYALNRILPAFRRRIRAKLELNLNGRQKFSSTTTTIQHYLLTNLDTLTSPSPIYAISLATFYFSGAYYHLSKRLWGLRYIFTRQPKPSNQRAGYEVLGVLLVLQIAVQGYLHMHSTVASSASATNQPTVANAGSMAGGSAVLDGGVEVSLDPNAYSDNNTLLFESGPAPNPAVDQDKIARMTHTPTMERGMHRYDLKDKEMMKWLVGRQARKCTLCLEPMKDPSVTTCGHLFCWTCICDWCREKPECPLCRQMCLVQHILPLRG